MSPRIQRLRMRLMKFQVHATHTKGKELTDADALSRAPNEQPITTDELAEKEVMIHVNLITNKISASTDGLEKIRIHTQQDKTLQIVIDYICNGSSIQKVKCNPIALPYWNDHHNMLFIEGPLMKGEKNVIPTVLRRDMLKGIHEGHVGMNNRDE